MEEALVLTPARLLAVLALVLLNGFFVAAEFALVTIRRTRIEQLIDEGSGAARAVKRALSDLDTFIAATQLGITMASLSLGWIGEPVLADLIAPAFEFVPENAAGITAHGVAFVIAFSMITAMHIIFGELAPKSVALQRTEPTALLVARPLEVFLTVFRPFIIGLNGAGRWATGLLGLRPATSEELVHSVEEIRMLVEETGEAGLLDPEERHLIGRAIEFGQLVAYQAMVPRTEVVAVPAGMPFAELVAFIAETGHARYPVFDGSLDDIVGVLHVTDVLRAMERGGAEGRAARALARPALSVPDSIRLDDVLTLMRQRRTEMAVLIDEYGGTTGIVTMFDLMERVFGEVGSEFEPQAITLLLDGSALLSGLALISDVNERFDLSLSDEEYDTIGGYVFGLLGREPHEGDEVAIDGYRARIEALDGLRIDRLRLIPAPELREG